MFVQLSIEHIIATGCLAIQVYSRIILQDRQCRRNVILWRVRVTIVAVKTQKSAFGPPPPPTRIS